MAAHAAARERLRLAAVLVELGEVYDAEAEVAEILDAAPEDIDAMDLFAKVKHIRGQLSQAVACWAQIQARSPQNGTALMHLQSMLQLARDPERGAGEFLALGPFQLWRKPAAHLELEEAFRLFLSRRPDEARARCDRLALKYQGKEPDVYKLAVLAEAWIAELSGDRDEACRVLEALGRERGFETDTDRILALARLYEQSGKPERLAKAVHICDYLEQHVTRASVLGRLASLHQALGHEDEARQYRTRFLSAFRERMHRPSLRDVTETAARHYLPLAKLRAIRFPADLQDGSAEAPGDGADETARREEAIRLVLMDRAGEARALLAAGTSPLDLRYLADLDVLDGDVREATRLYIESLAADPDDVRVLDWLLRQHAAVATDDAASSASIDTIADYFRAPGTGERARRALEGAIKASPLRPSLWRDLTTLHGILGHAAEAERCAARASLLDEAAERQDRAVGRSLAAAVYHFVGQPKGLMHEVWAGRRPTAAGKGGFLDEVLGNLTPEMVQNVKNTFLSVREYARAKLPHLTTDLLDFSYTYKITKEDEPSGGLSAGLPTALAFLSVFLNRPLPQDVASTGVLVADAHDVLVVKGVGDAEHKVRGAYNRNLRMLLLPRDNRADLRASPVVPPAVCGEIVRYVADLDEAASIVLGDDIWT